MVVFQSMVTFFFLFIVKHVLESLKRNLAHPLLITLLHDLLQMLRWNFCSYFFECVFEIVPTYSAVTVSVKHGKETL